MEDINIDAEYMNRWLPSPIDTMNAKVMYDVQQLITHYKSIIVPDEKVSIEFPVEGTPCADISENKVEIPCNLLLKGQVDDTIGAMIHELHHIKWTQAPKLYMYAVWTFFKNACKSITLEDGSPLYDSIFSADDISLKNILSGEVKNPSSQLQFAQQVFADIHLVVNALEDIRIDGNTPKNMKKYIDKGDAKAYPPYKQACENGELSKIDIYSLPYHLLFHHKGFCKNDFVSNTFADTDFILNNPPSELVVRALTTYEKLFTDHIKDVYNNGEMDLAKSSDSLEAYLGDMIMNDVEGGLEAEIGRELSPKEKQEILEGLEQIGSKETDLNTTEFSQPELSKSAVEVKVGGDSTKKFHDKKQAMQKNKLIPAELKAQIESFANLQTYTTTEQFARSVTYDTVIFDATK